MIDSFDYNKTIIKKRLSIRRFWMHTIVDFAWWIMIAIFPISGSLAYLIGKINRDEFHNDIITVLPIIIVSSIISIILLYKLISISSFKKIKGVNININRTALRNIVKSNKWSKGFDNKDFMVIYPESDTFEGCQLTIIHEGNDILYNLLTYLRGSRWPYNIFTEMKLKKIIIREIEAYRDNF